MVPRMKPYLISRREFLRASGLTISAFVLASCSAEPAAPFAPPPQTGLTPSGERSQPAEGFQAIPANSRLVVGANRVAFGLVENGKSVKEAQVHIRFYDINGTEPVLKSEADAPFYGDNLGEAGVYVTRATFDKAGKWGAEVAAQYGGKTEIARVGLMVAAHDSIPNIGDAAPPSKNPTLAEVNGDRRKICSAAEDDRELHTLSIADALSNGRPTVVLFATPAFCTSRTCGPSLEVVKAIARNYLSQVNFIHVEIYKEFQSFELADAVKEWHLESEPWLFFVNREGKIEARFEGGITTKEIVPEFQKFVGA